MQSFTWIYCGRWHPQVMFFFLGRFNRCWHQRSGCWFMSPRCPDYSLGILGLWLHIASTVFCARPWVEGLELPDDDEDEEKVDLGKWLESMVSWNSLGTWYWWFAAWEAHLRDYDALRDDNSDWIPSCNCSAKICPILLLVKLYKSLCWRVTINPRKSQCIRFVHGYMAMGQNIQNPGEPLFFPPKCCCLWMLIPKLICGKW